MKDTIIGIILGLIISAIIGWFVLGNPRNWGPRL